jgi:hypothetical protein
MDTLPTDPLLCPECGDQIAEHFEHGCYAEKPGNKLCKCTAPSKLLKLYAQQVNRINHLEGQFDIILRALLEYADDDNWGITSPLIFVKQYDGVNGTYGGATARKALQAIGYEGGAPAK